MELIGYYALFAFSISISGCYFWFWPILSDAREMEIQNSFTQYPVLSTVVYIFVSAAVAPLLLFPMLNSAMALRFETGLRTEVLKPDQKTHS